MHTFPTVSTGSIISFTAPGSRSTDGEPIDIPAVVIRQDPEDGTLYLFAFHFEGQFAASLPPELPVRIPYVEEGIEKFRTEYRPNYRMLYDAGQPPFPWRGDLCSLEDRFQSLRSEFEAFQTSVLEMVTGGTGNLPGGVAECGVGGVDSTRKRRG